MIVNKKRIIFKCPEDILDFLRRVEKYPYNMDVKSGKFVVDAKSLLGLMNIGTEKEIELKVYEDQCDDLWEDIEKYVAA